MSTAELDVVSVRGTHGLLARPKPGTVAVLRPAQGWVLEGECRYALASAVSVTLLLLGITPVASRELREVVRTASAQGSVITLSLIHGFCAEEQFGARWEAQHDGSSHAPLPHDGTAVNLPGI